MIVQAQHQLTHSSAITRGGEERLSHGGQVGVWYCTSTGVCVCVIGSVLTLSLSLAQAFPPFHS